MCGIAGIINFNQKKVAQEIVTNMIRVMRHRGPDGEGIFCDKNILLAHVRLSIIDVVGSKQPLSNEDGSVWVTFNGEIYNYIELRKKLISRGHEFRTHGDTETLVHLYEEYGKEMVNYLQGMFAFAIWDKNRQELLLFRDRMGIKPLYYCKRSDFFVFASEPKAILEHPDIDSLFNEGEVWNYLTYRSVPAPGTLFENIFKLKPGYLMVVKNNIVKEDKYWDIPLCRKDLTLNKYDKKPGQIIREVETILLNSVERHMISDVPLGAFLSGGVDSSLIVAMMSGLSGASVKTYSVGFKGYISSEVPYAKIVADKYKTDHHELILEEECFVDYLQELTWVRDSPLSEPADIPLHLLAKMASKDIKVLLSGEGSDELFAGYPKYAYDRFATFASVVPGRVIHAIADLLPARLRRVEIALRSYCETDRAERWAQWFSPFTKREKSLLLSSNHTNDNPTRQYVDNAEGCSSLDAMLYSDCKVWLPDNLLERGDRMTMGASVECRVPFLDHELVEYAFGLSASMKLKGFARKWIVKQIALKYLPEQIVFRPKVGFSVPLAQWFRGKLKDMCYDRIFQSNGLLLQIFEKKQLYEIMDEHCSCRKDNALKIWTLLGLSIWDNVFFNNHVAKY